MPSPTDTLTLGRPSRQSGYTNQAGAQCVAVTTDQSPQVLNCWHAQRAIRKGWPAVLVLNRPGADARRDRLLESWDTKPGYGRDEYPPAVGRGRRNAPELAL
jgi:hypothetical protein